MKIVNISDLEHDLYDIAIAKQDVENFWIKKGILKEHLSYTQFISLLNLGETSFVNNAENITIPLSFIII